VFYVKGWDDYVKWVKGKDTKDFLENFSISVLLFGTLLTVIGLAFGTYISGFPVLLAIIGSGLVLIGIVLYIFSEFYRIFKK